MKSFRVFIIFTVFAGFSTSPAISQWTASEGLCGGKSYDIKLLDTNLFLGGFGIYTKTISQSQWSRSLEMYTILELETAPGALYARGLGRLLRSLDEGMTWEPVFEFGGYGANTCCTIGPALFVTDWDSVYRSDDSGISWVNITGTLANLGHSYVLSDGPVLYLDNIDYNSRLYKSTDLGNSWQPVSPVGLDGNGLSCIFQDGDTVYAGNYYGVYIYVEGGPDWTEYSTGLPEEPYITDIVKYQGRIYCSSGRYGVFKYMFYKWVDDNDGLQTMTVWGLEASDTSLYGVTDQGPWQKNIASDWFPIYSGYTHLFIYSVIANDSGVWACSDLGLFKSEDNGESFSKVPPDDVSHVTGLFLTDSAYYLQAYYGLFISRDEGATWDSIFTGLEGRFIQDMAIGPAFSFAATNSGLYRSLTGIYQWEKLTNAMGSKNVHHLAFKDSVLLISVWENQMYRSTDNGDTYEPVAGYVHDLEIFQDTFWAISGDPGYSPDGAEWTFFNIPSPYYYGTAVAASGTTVINGGSYIYIAPSDYFLEISYDLGQSWTDIRGNLPLTTWPFINEATIFGDRIFVAPENYSLFYRDDLITDIPRYGRAQHDKAMVFPNPFLDYISVKIPGNEADDFFVQIFDMTGQIMVSKMVPGTTTTKMDLSFLDRGIYLLTLRSGSLNFSEKMVKIR